ncbi:MAG: acyl--CoA ligase [Fibrobacterales bacterium]
MSTPNSFHTWIDSLTTENPFGDAITVDGRSHTRGELSCEIVRVADALSRQGIGSGDQVMLILPNAIEWYTTYWALITLDALPVPLNPQIGKWELEGLLKTLSITLVIACVKFRNINHLANLTTLSESVTDIKTFVFLDADSTLPENKRVLWYSDMMNVETTLSPSTQNVQSDTLMLASTSGSTSNPKIITVTQEGFYKSQTDMARYLDLNSSDVMLMGMPLFHLGGFGMGLQNSLMGGSVIYLSSFDPVTMLKTIQEKRVTVLQLSSTLAKILLSVPNFESYDISSLRLCYFAGEVLPNEIARRFVDDIGIRVVNIIGSTETATMLVWDSEVDGAVDCNIYRTLPFTQVKLCDDNDNIVPHGEIGMIHIHTDGILHNYHNNSAETERALYENDSTRWFRTGDLGQYDETGRVAFLGRKKRALKRGANLIFPEDIEAFLLTHNDIVAVAITVEPHDLLGEMIKAHVQPREGCVLSGGKLRRYCSGNLSSYKIPDEFIITRELPKEIGKIQYKSIREHKETV